MAGKIAMGNMFDCQHFVQIAGFGLKENPKTPQDGPNHIFSCNYHFQGSVHTLRDKIEFNLLVPEI